MEGGGRRTNMDRPPHGRIRTTDHYKFENVDGGGQMDENPSVEAWSQLWLDQFLFRTQLWQFSEIVEFTC